MLLVLQLVDHSSGTKEMVRSQMKQQQRNQQAALPYDAKAVDAWAMGVLLYLLVTGCYPFEVRLIAPQFGCTAVCTARADNNVCRWCKQMC